MQKNTDRNMTMTPHSSQCKICHISGYSNICDYFVTGKCTLIMSIKAQKSE